ELGEVFSGQGERRRRVVADERGSGGDDELGLAVARAARLRRCGGGTRQVARTVERWRRRRWRDHLADRRTVWRPTVGRSTVRRRTVGRRTVGRPWGDH